jgi:hypothetical protein
MKMKKSQRKSQKISAKAKASSPVKKSQKSKGDDGMLRVRTPQSSLLRALKNAGLIVPEEIPTNEESVPLDFTQVGSSDLGSIHSRFAVRHAYAGFVAAKAAAKLVTLKRDLRIAQAKFRILNTDEKKNVVDAMMEEDDHIAKLLDRISIAEAELGMLNAVSDSYEALRNAASREMTRRIGERGPTDF